MADKIEILEKEYLSKTSNELDTAFVALTIAHAKISNYIAKTALFLFAAGAIMIILAAIVIIANPWWAGIAAETLAIIVFAIGIYMLGLFKANRIVDEETNVVLDEQLSAAKKEADE